ncbi:LysR substrate-binding domain-containing protein [Mesorhizobium sp. ANAO-SY3R2]|uniref:LysR substrate-binding domain-containing protein n=1 Tax=Mesorhizobium sp. ANAO-SY3R2 TaxID=3166644 RepID=UPI00366F7683
MELRQLRYLISIIDFGSFSKASGQLNVAQPALSQQIANLEAELETPVLIRSARGVVPTEAGVRLYRQARIILSQVEQAIAGARLSEFGDQFTGAVSVGLPTSTSTMIALPLIKKMRERFPQIHLRIVENLSGYLLEMLLKNRIDLAVNFSEEAVTGLSVEPMIEEDLFLVTSDPKDADVPIRLSDVASLPLSVPGLPHKMRSLIDSVCEQQKISLNVIADVDSLPVLRNIAASGMANVILPQSALAAPAALGNLYSRPIIEPRVSRPVSICRSEGAPKSRAIDATLDVLRQLVKELILDGTWRGVRLHEELADRAPSKDLEPRYKARMATKVNPPDFSSHLEM